MDRRLIVLALGMFAIGTDSFVVAGILPDLARSLDVTVALAGQMVTLFALSYAILSPMVAAAAAHWPRKRLLLSGLLVFIVANILTATAANLELALASRILAGLGAAMFSPTATATGASLVPVERRASALAIVVAGLSSATAFGAPLGTVLSGLGGWRLTMGFVALLGAAAAIGIAALLPGVPSPPPIGLRQRLAPLADSRVGLTLLTSLIAYGGLFVVYTYLGVTFDRVTHGDPSILAGLLFLWGLAATIGNLTAGKLTDRIGGRRIINIAITAAAIDFALLPWSSAHLATSIAALVVWGLCGWGLLVPQQHRLIGIAPATAPLLLGLNSAAVYIGASASGVIGAFGITFLDPHKLGLVGAALIAVSLLMAELAQARIRRRATTLPPRLAASPAVR